MKISIEEIVDGITELAQTYLPELVRVDYDLDFFAINNRKKKDYPRLFIMVNESITIGENINTVPITLRFADISDGMKNTNLKDKAIKSDMTQAASKLLDLMKGEDFFDDTISFQAIPFDRELNDGLSGVDLTVNCVTSKPCVDESEIPKPPNAPNVNLFTFEDFENISILTYCSDPDGLALELDSVSKPDYGTIELTANDIIKWSKEGATDVAQGIVDYTIKNTAGLEDTGRLTLAFEEIDITIDTPTEGQEIPSDEDITLSFTVTPATQDYISAIALVVDGVETVKRTPYSTADFTIDAGTLSEAAHTIQIRAYDTDDNQVFETPVRNITVTASFNFDNALQFDGQDDFLSPSSGEFGNNLTSFTLSWWWKLQTENFIIGSLPSNNNGWFVYYAGGAIRVGIRNGNVGAAIYMLPLPTDWTHFYLVYDGSLAENLRVQLYVDGVQVPIDSFTGNVATSLSATAGNSFLINSISSLFGQGAIDELIMKKSYTGTAQQAIDIYNNGQGADAAQIIPSPDRVYRFNESDPATVTVDEGADGVDLTLNNFTAPNFIPHT